MTEASKHTPGEWQAVQETETEWNITSPTRSFIATVLGGGISPESLRANAYLVAAAPQMLEALKSLQAILCNPEGDPCFAGSDGDRAVAREAFAAIARAEAAQ